MRWYEILIKILEILLNWPLLGALITGYFLVTFEDEIRKILGKAKLDKLGPAEFGQQEIDEVKLEPVNKDSSANDWEFMYYGKVLVVNTMKSLLRLSKLGSATKPVLFSIMIVPPSTDDVEVEKEAQFSTLLNHGFIEPKGELYSVTAKGFKLLDYYGIK